jgi:uncharacterized phiE125 gp8 family phage protein
MAYTASYIYNRNFREHQVFAKTVDAATEPVTTAEAKTQLILDSDFTADDALIDTYITAARLICEAYTGISFINSTYVEQLDLFPYDGERISLSVGKVASITSINYLDVNGDSQTWSTDNYKLLNTGLRAEIALKYNKSYPATLTEAQAVTITYVSGYGAAASDVPQNIKQAILLIVAEMYANREDRVEQLPKASQAILRHFSVNEKV